MEKKKIYGDMFIIPNEAIKYSEFLPFAKESAREKLNYLGIKPDENEKMIQVWFTGSGEDNWNDHAGALCRLAGIEEPNMDDKDRYLKEYITRYLPESMLKNVHEGETITIDCNNFNCTLVLTAKQLDYRYRGFGRFEDALKHVL